MKPSNQQIISYLQQIFQYIGEDPAREGLKHTPRRIMKSWETLFSGYEYDQFDIRNMLTKFDGEDYDEMVLLKDIEWCSFCEHHMLPFYGKAHIAYIPNGKVVGISKLARLLEIYTRRLQIQERITKQITSSLDECLDPKGSACVLEASHSCMTCRGVLKQNSIMVTSSITGNFQLPEVRQEFMNLIKG